MLLAKAGCTRTRPSYGGKPKVSKPVARMSLGYAVKDSSPACPRSCVVVLMECASLWKVDATEATPEADLGLERLP